VTKTSSNTLVKEIRKDFITFLMKGNLESFSQKIDSELNIDQMEKLLKIHFVLKEDVIEFITNLPKQIRRIKTTVEKKHENISNEIRGKIDWGRTIKSRYSANPFDDSQFVITRIERNYNTTENIILKALLSKIYYIVFQLLNRAIENEYEWVQEWFKDSQKLRETVKRIYLRNVYMKRIEFGQNFTITSRMISNTLKSRNSLYRKAAELLQLYRKLLNYKINVEEVQELLHNTFIKPEKTEVLFELYWVFKIIKQITKGKKVTYHLIEGRNNAVAEWEDQNYRYRIYHDSTGSFTFQENWKDISISDEDGYLPREVKVVDKWKELGDKIFQTDFSDSLWGGRPDIIIEKYHKAQNKPEKIFIGEVKYTNSRDYIARGLKELLEYIALIRDHNKYIENINNLFDETIVHESVKGALFIDHTSDIEIGEQKDNNVKVFMFGQEDEKLSEINDLL